MKIEKGKPTFFPFTLNWKETSVIEYLHFFQVSFFCKFSTNKNFTPGCELWVIRVVIAKLEITDNDFQNLITNKTMPILIRSINW